MVLLALCIFCFFFFFQAEDGIRDGRVTGVQTCALPIYWIDPIASTSQPQKPLALPDKPSIAVLPFTNLSGDPKEDYFSDGRSEERRVGKECRSRWSP